MLFPAMSFMDCCSTLLSASGAQNKHATIPTASLISSHNKLQLNMVEIVP